MQPATAIVEEEEDDDDEVDEAGVEAKDVELVMTQARAGPWNRLIAWACLCWMLHLELQGASCPAIQARSMPAHTVRPCTFSAWSAPP